MRLRPRRSILYMPAANSRAMMKATTLPADSLIFDLEDAVAPDMKAAARLSLIDAIKQNDYGHREIMVRVNGLDTSWGQDDLRALRGVALDGLVFPKVDTAGQVHEIIRSMDAAGLDGDLSVWAMTETPKGVLNANEVYSASPRLKGIIMGTSDLAKELRVPHTPDRIGFIHALSHCVLAARANGLEIFDGIHLNFRDLEEFEAHCQQGLTLGFDGKTLIHPSQIAISNTVFAPTEEQVSSAHAIVDAWATAQEKGEGVCVVDGKLIENLHVEEANRTLQLAEAIAVIEAS